MDLPQEGLFIGTNNYRGLSTKYFFLKSIDFVMYILSVKQVQENQLCSKIWLYKIYIMEMAAAFIDPHGQDLLEILGNIPKERWDDVVYFDPAYAEMPMGLNMFEYDRNRPEQKILLSMSFFIYLKAFCRIFQSLWAQLLSNTFRNSAGLVMEHPESGCTLLIFQEYYLIKIIEIINSHILKIHL